MTVLQIPAPDSSLPAPRCKFGWLRPSLNQRFGSGCFENNIFLIVAAPSQCTGILWGRNLEAGATRMKTAGGWRAKFLSHYGEVWWTLKSSPGNNFDRFLPRNNRKTVIIKRRSLPMIGDTELMTGELPLAWLSKKGSPNWVLFSPESKPAGNIALMFIYWARFWRSDLFQETTYELLYKLVIGGGYGIFREAEMEIPGDSLDSIEGEQHPFGTVKVGKNFFDW